MPLDRVMSTPGDTGLWATFMLALLFFLPIAVIMALQALEDRPKQPPQQPEESDLTFRRFLWVAILAASIGVPMAIILR